MNFNLAELAVLIGVANGLILLLKPIARLHQRIDRNERDLWDVKGQLREVKDVMKGDVIK